MFKKNFNSALLHLCSNLQKSFPDDGYLRELLKSLADRFEEEPECDDIYGGFVHGLSELTDLIFKGQFEKAIGSNHIVLIRTLRGNTYYQHLSEEERKLFWKDIQIVCTHHNLVQLNGSSQLDLKSLMAKSGVGQGGKLDAAAMASNLMHNEDLMQTCVDMFQNGNFTTVLENMEPLLHSIQAKEYGSDQGRQSGEEKHGGDNQEGEDQENGEDEDRKSSGDDTGPVDEGPVALQSLFVPGKNKKRKRGRQKKKKKQNSEPNLSSLFGGGLGGLIEKLKSSGLEDSQFQSDAADLREKLKARGEKLTLQNIMAEISRNEGGQAGDSVDFGHVLQNVTECVNNLTSSKQPPDTASIAKQLTKNLNLGDDPELARFMEQAAGGGGLDQIQEMMSSLSTSQG